MRKSTGDAATPYVGRPPHAGGLFTPRTAPATETARDGQITRWSALASRAPSAERRGAGGDGAPQGVAWRSSLPLIYAGQAVVQRERVSSIMPL
jgi:hypothetical protein